MAAVALVAGSLLSAGAAHADSAPTTPSSTTPATVTADSLTAPQINGVVWTQLIVGNTVYVGGSFTKARPSGSPAGVNEVARSNMLAYDVRTGVLLPAFAPKVNGQVLAIAATADKKHLYIGGDFTKIGTAKRSRVAEIGGTTGNLVGGFDPAASGTVRSIVLRGSYLYLGGSFAKIKGKVRTQIAAVSPKSGSPSSWAPKLAGGQVTSIAISPDGKKVVLGGKFTSTNGYGRSIKSSYSGYGMSAVSRSTGKSMPWPVSKLVQDGGLNAAITSLSSSSAGVVGSGYVYGVGGNLEGAFRADWNGNLVWLEDCHGDTYSSVIVGSIVYTAGHAHYCGNLGGFRESTPTMHYPALAFTMAATQKLTNNGSKNYADFSGKPAPTLLDWFPTMSIGTYTGQSQAAWSVTGNSKYVVYGGEFPTVNGVAQEGLARFAVSSLASNSAGPQASGATFVPSAVSSRAGQVTVSWPSNSDPDNSTLTYTLYRDSDYDHPVTSMTSNSTFYYRPSLQFVDTGVTAGQTYSYRVRATDPFGNSVLGDAISVTVASATTTGYEGAVLQDAPVDFWRLGEGATAQATDSTSRSPLVVSAVSSSGRSVETATPPIIGTGSSYGHSRDESTPAMKSLTIEAWFKAAKGGSGTIVDFGNNATFLSSVVDRSLVLQSNGTLTFGVRNPGRVAVATSKSYADGKWHQAVVTVSTTSMRLYVDGTQVTGKSGTFAMSKAWGYWRVGGDSAWPGPRFFVGSIRDVSVYSSTLSADRVAAHYAAADVNS
ncbi:concanavalin A-like lectin/glucanase superfamily protein [Frondihabitans sp. PhB188]|uniref:LamG-like jellyroll fold domain-containing protein n=1 Tax=Frondihabitans sp. PhB188 TaxID=2485200 RepID=UPI000F499231|nr:LamG-like jellyroll fold domain-containing protein [Frondihabitans sp. PhB188]ROQ38587.1 concanavalin A-like lectin/glucanase superfamily protein [Frondihabitans sp. PhB188]